jgi:hypothetical protein
LNRCHEDTVAERNGSLLIAQRAAFAAQTVVNWRESKAIPALERRQASRLVE